MKNADEMLRTIISIVDTSGDGKIQYEGGFFFRPGAFWGQDGRMSRRN